MQKQALIVEDEQLVRDLLSVQLSKAGFEVTGAEDGERGLHELNTGRAYDVVFIDLVMPKINGLSLLKSMRELPSAMRFVPVVMITGHRDKSLIMKAAELGATEFLIKPWSQEDLTQKVASVLQPRLEFEEIRSVASRLHVDDRELLKGIGVPELRDETHRAFGVTISNERYCFIVRRGTKVSSLASMKAHEAAGFLTIFCRRKNKWIYCWPDLSVNGELNNFVRALIGA